MVSVDGWGNEDAGPVRFEDLHSHEPELASASSSEASTPEGPPSSASAAEHPAPYIFVFINATS